MSATPSSAIDSPPRSGRSAGLYLLFFISGFPALLYQIVWQRSLFTMYGVNVESVTMVVTAFMVGLGLGSLVGGRISKTTGVPLLLAFGAVEMAVGLFGWFSLPLFHWAARQTAGGSAIQTGIVAFLLVALPTMLMGSTLPLLVAYNVQRTGNVGSSVGALYAVNTFGSAVACFCAGYFIMRIFGESGSVHLAVAFNLSVGLAALLFVVINKDRGTVAEDPVEHVLPGHEPERTGFGLSLIVVALAGFIALGYEIVWFRLFSFANAGRAETFAYLLAAYLAGIGVGSLVSERLARTSRPPQDFVRFVSTFVLVANLIGFLVAPALAEVVRRTDYRYALIAVAIASAFLGATFPLMCHASVRADRRAGSRMSYLYLANIIGSALGSFIIGFIWMDRLTIQQIAIALAIVGVLLSIALLIPAEVRGLQILAPAGVALLGAILVVSLAPRLFNHIYEKLLLKQIYAGGMQFKDTVETRSGVINVTTGGMVFGGGAYDGVFNLDLVHDDNGLFRAFAAQFLSSHPRDVLMVGLASGSWAEVVANDPRVENFTIVEINPGYLRIIRQHPIFARLLANPKVHIVIDDGRRWLVSNPDRKFDLVVMNTTLNWRAHTSNLLSVEFLELMRGHLKPGGVHYYNTTGSTEAQATGVRVFPYAFRVANCLAVSDQPIQPDKAQWRAALAQYAIEGQPVFDLSRPDHRARLDEVVSMLDKRGPYQDAVIDTETGDAIRARTPHVRLITDDNMGTEWRQ